MNGSALLPPNSDRIHSAEGRPPTNPATGGGGSPSPRGEGGRGGGGLHGTLTISRLTPELREGWAELLGRYHWDVFATLTYANSVWAPEKVARDFRRWLYGWQAVTAETRGLCRRVGESPAGEPTYRGSWVDRYNRGRGAVWVLGIESHRSGALHAHALIAWNPNLTDLRWEVGGPLWYRPRADGGFGHGFVRLEAPRTQSDVAWYVAKYVVKDGEIVLSPNFKAARLACA